MANATRYFDNNGTSPGFGTLTGSWGATGPTTGWNSSSAGTGAVSGYTFDNTDTAVFGVAGQTATGGTVTIPTGLAVTLNKIQTANLTTVASQIITYAGTGTLTIGGTSPTITANSDLRIDAPFRGSSGFTANGTATVRFASTANASDLAGTVTLSSGFLGFGAGFNDATGPTSNQLPSVQGYNIGAAGRFDILNTTNAGFTISAPITGSGTILLSNAQSATAASNTITFANMSGFTGVFSLWNNQIAGNYKSFAAAVLMQTSGTIKYEIGAGAAVDGSQKIFSIPSTATGQTSSANIVISTGNNQPVTNTTYAFNANQGSGAMVLNGPITRQDGASGYSAIGPLTFTLGGSNTESNTVNGLISSVSGHGVLNLAKADAGRWIISNANTYAGSTTISGGFLRATNAQAFGTAGSIILSGGTLELAGVSPSNAALNTVGTISVVSGTSTLTQQITLGGSTTFSADADATLILNNTSSAIAGAQPLTLAGAGTVTINNQITQIISLTKIGAGVATLTNAANSFTANPTISAGVLAVSSLAASGTNSPLGAGSSVSLSSSGVLRYTGSTGAILSRTVTGTGLSGAGFDNTGSGSLAVTSATLDGTISLAASNSASLFNTLTATISSGGFTKTGDGRWIINKLNNLSGTTAVNAGTLMAAPDAASASAKLLGGNVTVAAGAKIQTSSDNSQQGKNTYTNLTFAGTVGNPARIRIGGSAVSPTVQMSGNLTLPASGTVTFDLSADVFKTPGTYTLIEFTGSGAAVNWTGSNVTAGSTLSAGLQAAFTYYAAATPKRIDVTISKV